jgi:UDP-N-acetylmuramoyl-L-alanyl-D-glutamate--2,6-diaminopimelate ligase
MDEYLEAKLLLFSGLDDRACAVVNADDPAAGRVLGAARGEKLTYGIRGPADLRALAVSTKARDTQFLLRFRREEAKVHLPLPGEHNVYNALAAASVAVRSGVSLDEIAERLGRARSVIGRYEFLEASNGAAVIIDFAHSPDSLERMLESLRPFYSRVICVFGCGGNSDREKRPIMGRISGRLADVSILTTDNPKTEDPAAILDEVEDGMRPTGGRYERIPDRRCAIRRALELASPRDAVLLAGKGHETYQIVGKEFLPYSDAQFLREERLAR